MEDATICTPASPLSKENIPLIKKPNRMGFWRYKENFLRRKDRPDKNQLL
jgi:hypothetical protein